MYLSKVLKIVPAVVLLMAATSVGAATVSTSLIASTPVGQFGNISDATSTGLVAGVVGDFETEGNGAGGSAQADGFNGTLKFDLTARTDGGPPGSIGEDGAQIIASTQIRETVFVKGNGTFSILLDYDAFWAGARGIMQVGISASEFSSSITEVPSGFDTTAFLNDTSSGTYEGSLRKDFQIDDLQDLRAITITWQMTGTLRVDDATRTGFFDASNTGTLGLFASDGVEFLTSTNGFLTGSPTPVPLPASGLLLAAGLAGFLRIQRRRN